MLKNGFYVHNSRKNARGPSGIITQDIIEYFTAVARGLETGWRFGPAIELCGEAQMSPPCVPIDPQILLRPQQSSGEVAAAKQIRTTLFKAVCARAPPFRSWCLWVSMLDWAKDRETMHALQKASHGSYCSIQSRTTCAEAFRFLKGYTSQIIYSLGPETSDVDLYKTLYKSSSVILERREYLLPWKRICSTCPSILLCWTLFNLVVFQVSTLASPQGGSACSLHPQPSYVGVTESDPFLFSLFSFGS